MSKFALQPGKRLLFCIVCDLVALAAFLLTFAYFHHVRVKDYGVNDVPDASLSSLTPAPAFEATAAPTAAPESETDEQTPPEEAVESGLFAGNGAFEGGDAVAYENSYRSENVSVTVQKFTTEKDTYFVADIYLKDITSFRTAVAIDYAEFNEGKRKNVMQVTQLAGLTNAIDSISGDNYVFRNAGLLVIRNGEVLASKLPITEDLCVLFLDGTIETYKKYTASKEFLNDLVARGAYQAWCFGPRLLDGGEPMTNFNSSVVDKNPRSAFGYYEPGHYCFVLVDGRQKGYSEGMTLTELSQLFYDLGCKEAYNLDGGDTVAMAFGTDLVNHPEPDVPRSVSDILYICEPNGGAPAEEAEGGDAE